MKILSVNVGLPREVLFGKDTVTTGIFKEPVEGRVKLRKLNLHYRHYHRNHRHIVVSVYVYTNVCIYPLGCNQQTLEQGC